VTHTRLLALATVVALCACAASNGAGSAATALATVTKAIYADDAPGVSAAFDDGVRSEISRAEVGLLSDKMHALGTYQGATLLGSDPQKSEFTYRVDFERGAMNVAIRIAADGKLAAYRAFPVEH